MSYVEKLYGERYLNIFSCFSYSSFDIGRGVKKILKDFRFRYIRC